MHKRDDWQEKIIEKPVPAIQQVTVFNVQWTDCPVEVEAEVSRLWRENELRNDNCYYAWDSDSEAPWTEDQEDGDDRTMATEYPLIDAYLRARGLTRCLIHWWW